MDQERTEGKSEVIDTNNFWMFFSGIKGPFMERVYEKKITKLGDSWTRFINEYPETYEETRAIVLRRDVEYAPKYSEFFNLLNTGSTGEAQALQEELRETHKELLRELDEKLTKAFQILEGLGASPDILLR